MWRTGNVLSLELCLHLGEASLKCFAVRQGSRLIRCPSAQLRIARPRGEIGVGGGIVDRISLTLDADLPPKRLPVEQQRDVEIVAQLHRLAAFKIGVKSKPTMPPSSAPCPFSNTIRTEGWPSPPVVASAIALESLGSLACASANHSSNSVKGSGLSIAPR